MRRNWLSTMPLQGGRLVCLCNVHVLETARRDTRVMEALEEARVVFPDGAPIAWLQRRAGHRAAQRVAGPDLMEAVIREGRAFDLRHALYGSSPDVLVRLEARLRVDHPGVRVVSAIAPGFGDQSAADTEREIDRLNAEKPDIVWLALGAPRQELWAARFAEQLAPAVVVCVGAAFDFLARTKPRAPEWMQVLGLEPLHRATTEPRRLSLRYLTTNSSFVVRAALQLARPVKEDCT